MMMAWMSLSASMSSTEVATRGYTSVDASWHSMSLRVSEREVKSTYVVRMGGRERLGASWEGVVDGSEGGACLKDRIAVDLALTAAANDTNLDSLHVCRG